MSVEIKYNGNTIASVESGKIAIIPCKGKKMAGNIVVKGDSDIKYKGETLATLSNGQTATIPCNGKIMQDDITVIALGTPDTPTEYKLSGTWKFNETVYSELLDSMLVNFTSNGATFEEIYIDDIGGARLEYHYSSNYDFVYAYMSGSWVNEAYRTITFVGEQTVSKEEYEWFTANAKKLITFTIESLALESATYQAEKGMTWGEWVESEYNIDSYWKIYDGEIRSWSGYILEFESKRVIESDKIVPNGKYFKSFYGGGGSN